MKRSTIVLSAAALGGLSAAAFAGGTADQAKTGWPLILGYQPTSLTEAAGTQQATTPRVVLAAGSNCPQNQLYDNGGPDEVNGYSNGTVGAFGARRTLLDDFEVPNGETWTLTDFVHSHVWNAEAPGSGTDFEIAIWSDSAGQPAERIVDARLTTNYLEVGGPDMFFSRAEAISFSTFDPIELDAGRYWFEAAIVGPENNFWLTAAQQNSECWVNYEDLGGFASGTAQFGSASDVNFCIGGTTEVGPANQFGLKHSPKGNAGVAADGATLIVSNIGSSGKDGVSASLGDASGGYVGHVLGPAGGTLVVSGVGTQDGTSDVSFGAVIVELDSGVLLSMDTTGLNATMYTRNMYLDEELVSSVTVPSGTPSLQSADAMPPADYVIRRTADNVIYLIELDTPITTGADMIDEIELIADGSTSGIEGLTSGCITGADTGDLTLDDGAIIMFGNEHRRAGTARITTVAPPPGPMTPTLNVSNLGSSGQDGVTIDLDNAAGADATIEPFTVNVTGDRINQTATGCFDDAGDTDLGRTTIVSGGGFTVLQGDFASISAANTVLIELYDDDVFVNSVVRPGGGNTMFLFGVAPDPLPLLIGVGARTAGGPGFVWRFDGDADVRTSVSGGTTIGIGDEIRVIANEPDGVVSAVDALSITTNNGPSLVLTGETVDNPGQGCGGGGPVCDPTSGDVTGEGCVSFADVLAVLGAWGTSGDPGIPGDANCDGNVTFADILLILGTWGQGCK